MTQDSESKYANLADVIAEYNINFEIEADVGKWECDGKTYTFETHPFYSTLHDYTNVEFPDDALTSASVDCVRNTDKGKE